MLSGLRGSLGRAAVWAATIGAWTTFGADPASTAQQPTWLNIATFQLSPGVFDYSSGGNWTTGIAPGLGDTADFAGSTTTNIGISAAAQVNAWIFAANAPAYTITYSSSGTALDFFGAGIVIGGGSVAITSNAGGLQFNNASSAGSATIVNNVGSVLAFINTSTAGTANITNNALLDFGDMSTAGYSTILNNHDVAFARISTAGNATIANLGLLQFTDTSTAGNANITNNGAIQFNNISSSGHATITTNGGVVNFYDNSSASFATITNNAGCNGSTCTTGGSTYFYDSSSAGNSTITTNAGGITRFWNTSTADHSSLVSNVSGTISFNDSSTAANSHITVNSNGALQFVDAGSAGSATIENRGSVLFFDSSSAGSSTINNNGGVVQYMNSAGSDKTTELGRIVNTSTGSIDISNKSSVASTYIGSIAGAGTVSLGATILGVGGNNDSTTFDGVISGVGGSLKKLGTGTLTLTAHNTFTGTTTVDGGTLLSTNWLSSNMNVVNSGGALAGMGNFTAAQTQINAGGTLAPGTPSAMGFMQIQSQLLFSPNSFYQVKIDSTSTDYVQSARADLNGAVVKVKPIGIVTQTTTYHILSGAIILNGTFSSAVIDGSPFARNPTISYSGNNVYLTVDPGLLTLLLQPGVTGTPKQVAAGIDAALLAGVTLPPGFNGVFNLSGDALVAALKQLSGQGASSTKQTSGDASNSFMGAMFDPFASGRPGGGAPGSAYASVDDDEALGYAKKRKFTRPERNARNAVTGGNNIYDPRWSLWGSAYGTTSTTTGNAAQGTNDVTSRAFGFVTGADYNVNARTTVGFALGGGGSNYGVSGGLGTGRAEMFQLGLFARHTMCAAYIAGGLGYTFQNVTTDRTVTVAGTDQLRATFNANTFSGRVEGGYRYATPVVGVTPYAALQVTNISLPNYGESVVFGNTTFALNYSTQDTTIVRTELGARFERSFALQTAMLTLRGRAAWAHDEGSNRNVSAVFGSLPGSNFTINGAMPSKDIALVSAGADLAWMNNVTLSGMFEGQFSDTTTGYGGKGTVRYVW